MPSFADTGEETLQLVRKDPRTWQRIESETTAKISFHRQRGDFSCESHHLECSQRYALIQHDESSPRGRGYIIAVATSSDDGTIKLMGNWQRWHGKIWLVIADDVRGHAGDTTIDQLIHWQPSRYLFENKPLL